MVEETLFESESGQTRRSVADYLRAVAERLDAGDPITLSAGDDSITLEVPERTTFEVKAERETSDGGGPGELSVEFELEWREDGSDGADGELSIE